MGSCGSVTAPPVPIAAATTTTTTAATTQQKSPPHKPPPPDHGRSQSITTTTTTTTTTMTTSNIVRLDPNTRKKQLLKQDSSMLLNEHEHQHPLLHHDSSKEGESSEDSTTSTDVENDKIVNEMMRENDQRIASLNRILSGSSSSSGPPTPTNASSSTTTTTTTTTSKPRPRLSIHSEKEIKSTTNNKPTRISKAISNDTPRSNEKAKNQALEQAEEELRLAKEKVEMINLLKQMNETPSKWLQQLADQDASQASFEAKLAQLQKLKSEAAERVRIERESRIQHAVADMSNSKFDEFQNVIQRDKISYDATLNKSHAGAVARERALQRTMTPDENAAELAKLEKETAEFRAQLSNMSEQQLVKSVKKQKAIEHKIRAAETAATQAEEAARKAAIAAETARALAEQAKTKALEHSPSQSLLLGKRTGSISTMSGYDDLELDELDPINENKPTALTMLTKRNPLLPSASSSSLHSCEPEEEMRRLTAELHALFRVMNTTEGNDMKPNLESLHKISPRKTTLTSPMKQRLQSEIAAKRSEIERLELQLLTADQCEERVRTMIHEAESMNAGTARDVANKKVALWNMHIQLKRKQEAQQTKQENMKQQQDQQQQLFEMMQKALAQEKMTQATAMG